jgi:glutathione S-transferase
VPGQTLYPTGLRERADVNRWLFWSAQHWGPALGVLTWENWMKGLFGAGERDVAAVARGERELAQPHRLDRARRRSGAGARLLLRVALAQ